MSNEFKFTGKVFKIGDVVHYGTDDAYCRRELVLETYERGYINYIAFEFTMKGCSLLDDIKSDNMVEVTFTPRSNQSKNGTYFTNLRAYKIQVLEDLI